MPIPYLQTPPASLLRSTSNDTLCAETRTINPGDFLHRNAIVIESPETIEFPRASKGDGGALLRLPALCSDQTRVIGEVTERGTRWSDVQMYGRE